MCHVRSTLLAEVKVEKVELRESCCSQEVRISILLASAIP